MSLAASTRRRLVHALAGGNSIGLGVVSRSGGGSHSKKGLENDTTRKNKHIPVLDLLRHGQECLLDIGRVLSRSLKEGNRELVRELLQIESQYF